jgi:dihydroorotase
VALVRQAKAEGLPITCDVSINNLMLTDLDIGYFDARARLDPPLRQSRDRDALRAALADGTIDALCSDHTPVSSDDKTQTFADAAPGATGLELLLPVALQFAADSGLPLVQALGCVGHRAARAAGLTPATLEVGAAAECILVDPQARWRATPEALRSQSRLTPLSEQELPGRVRHAVIDGRVVWSAQPIAVPA